ncbi:hypothetical protein BDF14DRAFT_1881690 [Spinellus fusiger]|nr:hypothetical protein BDF14DRAFT_1881690 [Spinellus fusiger]
MGLFHISVNAASLYHPLTPRHGPDNPLRFNIDYQGYEPHPDPPWGCGTKTLPCDSACPDTCLYPNVICPYTYMPHCPRKH